MEGILLGIVLLQLLNTTVVALLWLDIVTRLKK